MNISDKKQNLISAIKWLAAKTTYVCYDPQIADAWRTPLVNSAKAITLFTNPVGTDRLYIKQKLPIHLGKNVILLVINDDYSKFSIKSYYYMTGWTNGAIQEISDEFLIEVAYDKIMTMFNEGLSYHISHEDHIVRRLKNIKKELIASCTKEYMSKHNIGVDPNM